MPFKKSILSIIYSRLEAAERAICLLIMFSSSSANSYVNKDNSSFETASWLSKLFFLWINPVINLGYQKPLEATDIPSIPKEFAAKETERRFNLAWQNEVEKHGNKASICRAMFTAFKDNILLSIVFFIPYVGTILMQPFLVNDILSYLENDSNTFFHINNGPVLAVVFGLVSFINLVTYSISFTYISESCICMKSACVAAVFSKSVRLSVTARSQHTTGQKLSLIGADAERIWHGGTFLNWVWGGPVIIVSSMVLLIIYIRYAALCAFGVLIALAGIQVYVGQQVGKVREKQMEHMDERAKVINESLQGIRILKYYAWEGVTAQKIESIRQKEVSHLIHYHLLRMINIYITYVAPLIVPYVLFYVYIYLGGHLTISKVYTIQALLNVVRLPFSITPMAWANYQEAQVAMGRLGEFLLLDEAMEVSAATTRPKGDTIIDNQMEMSRDKALDCTEVGLEMKMMKTNHDDKMETSHQPLFDLQSASFSYQHPRVCDATALTATLQSISLAIYPGELFGVVGGVGSGKTSLLAALLGEMHQIGGSMRSSSPRVAYVAQEHWICNSSVIDNILFYTALDEEKYGQVIDSSQLLADLMVLPHADYTSIGERGVNLSGGQKARVSVARALYAGTNDNNTGKCELCVFDDPLASVDVHVGKALFTHALTSPMLRDKARVLVMSSNYHLLPLFDKVIVMKNERIESMGPWSEIKERHPEYNVTGQNSPNATDADDDDNQKDKEDSKNQQGAQENLTQQFKSLTEAIHARRAQASSIHGSEDREKGAVALQTYLAYFSFALSFVSRTHHSNSKKRADDDFPISGVHHRALESGLYVLEGDSVVTKEEDSRRGSDKVYSARDLATGVAVVTFIFTLFSVAQGLRIIVDLWMGIYATHMEEKQQTNDQYFMQMYTVLTWTAVGIGFVRSLVFILVCLGSSFNLHHMLLTNVFAAPINKYFDITPIGRIMNRFTKDFDSMDAQLPDFFHLTMQNVFFVLSIIVVCLMSSAYFILLFLPVGVAFYYIQAYFRKASREMKRLDSISRSPIYSLYGEVLSGLVTIKAFKYVPVFTTKFYALIDENMSHFFVFWFSARWLAVRLDLISNCISFFVAILAVILKLTNQQTNSNFIGIALVYAVQLTALLQWTVRTSIDTETNMTSVERLLYFNQIPAEQVITKSYDSAITTSQSIPLVLRSHPLHELLHWPSAGQVTLTNVLMRYREDLPLVLRGVNLVIPGGCKVGICGRTAAGKSSLMLALFRIVECEEDSSICIDGVNIQTVPLHVLRSQLTIIPQDPFMFSGSLRDNLDPFQDYSDAEICEALERVQLLDDVQNKFPGGLQYSIAERGENISVGQRQLVCIARALLRKSKVIVMDEATASVDSVTDSKIQHTIREQFKHCTVLTIAHRLETIADYDMVVVMQQGQVAEAGSPLDLLKSEDRSNGAFRGFVEELGSERMAAFVAIAERRRAATTHSS